MSIPLEAFSQLIVVSLLIEAIVTNIKPVYDKTKGWQIDIILTLIISIVVCILVNADIFTLVGLPMMFPFIGAGLTGILVSRGANALHELIQAITVLRINWKTDGSK